MVRAYRWECFEGKPPRAEPHFQAPPPPMEEVGAGGAQLIPPKAPPSLVYGIHVISLIPRAWVRG